MAWVGPYVAKPESTWTRSTLVRRKSFFKKPCVSAMALPIEKPKDWEDFEFIRWYLLHEHTAIFTDDGSWYLLVQNRCRHLGEDNLCGIYETRPQICRDYTTKNCEYEDDWVYDHYFEAPEQVDFAPVPQSIEPPRVGQLVQFEKTLLDPADRLVLRAQTSWKGVAP